MAISKIEFFYFSWTNRVKQTFNKWRPFKTYYPCKSNLFSSNFNKSRMFICFITWNQVSLLPVPRWVGDSTDLLSSSNIWKTVRVNIAFAGTFFLWYYFILSTICEDFKEVVISAVVDLILLLLCTLNKILFYRRCFSDAFCKNLRDMNLSRSFWSEVVGYFW